MVYCFRAELAFSTAARRDAVFADLEQQIAVRPRWGDTALARTTSDAGMPALQMEARFVAQQDRADLVARLELFATGQRTPEPGSWYELHACSHDGSPSACVPDPRRVW